MISTQHTLADALCCLLKCERERNALYGYVCGLLGLLQLISGRDDMPRAIIDVLETNHRVVDAKAFLATITPPTESNQ